MSWPATCQRRARAFSSIATLLLLTACQIPVKPVAILPEATIQTPAEQLIKPTIAPKEAPEPEPLPVELDLYARLQAQLGDDHCDDSPEQQRWTQLYASRPERFEQRIAPMLPLLDYVLAQLEDADLPGEFALIPIIESDYRPTARSAQGPAGMWQFTADTARHFGLAVSGDRDERLSVVAATDAAVTMLSQLHGSHGDWVLAAAGYNAGPYRVRKLLERSPDTVAGQLPIGLSRTTYDYVEKLRAWACMLSAPERFGIDLPDPTSLTRLTRVQAPSRLQRLPLLSEASGVSADVLRTLNPLLRTTAPTRSDRDLLLPEDAAAELLSFVSRVQNGEVPLPEPRFHTVKAGDTLGAIARREGVLLADLLRWNGLTTNSVLRIRQVLRLEP
ncbi:transglycosylase SLT domain-containing protein [Aquimonas sp.]|jgi:membrane-bound lytic murein transglycosylase D|uniref:lytic transglycosylase domain-containing protein n=1 Tax=Aquimonas sp. TaxID=1872588 RepID=UPI0037BF458E